MVEKRRTQRISHKGTKSTKITKGRGEKEKKNAKTSRRGTKAQSCYL
jgi:hypothetical protein